MRRSEKEILREQEPKNAAGHQRTGTLARDVREHFATGHSPGEPEPESDRRIQMCARDIPQRVNHREDDKTEGERDAYVCDRTHARLVDYDCARACENQREGADEILPRIPSLFHRPQMKRLGRADLLAPFFHLYPDLIAEPPHLPKFLLLRAG